MEVSPRASVGCRRGRCCRALYRLWLRTRSTRKRCRPSLHVRSSTIARYALTTSPVTSQIAPAATRFRRLPADPFGRDDVLARGAMPSSASVEASGFGGVDRRAGLAPSNCNPSSMQMAMSGPRSFGLDEGCGQREGKWASSTQGRMLAGVASCSRSTQRIEISLIVSRIEIAMSGCRAIH
jgi:hypothetical protein